MGLFRVRSSEGSIEIVEAKSEKDIVSMIERRGDRVLLITGIPSISCFLAQDAIQKNCRLKSPALLNQLSHKNRETVLEFIKVLSKIHNSESIMVLESVRKLFGAEKHQQGD